MDTLHQAITTKLNAHRSSRLLSDISDKRSSEHPIFLGFCVIKTKISLTAELRRCLEIVAQQEQTTMSAYVESVLRRNKSILAARDALGVKWSERTPEGFPAGQKQVTKALNRKKRKK